MIKDKRKGLDDVQRISNKTTDTTIAVQNHTVTNVNITDYQELDDMVKSMMTKSQNSYQNGHQRADICTVCGKEGKGNAIKDHIEANHLEGVSIPCNNCEKTFRSRVAQRQHFAKHHK